MGAVGTDYYVELINEGIAVFAKTNGQLLQTTGSSSFFGVSNYPAQKMANPRILFDKDNQRWIASMIYSGSNNIILAVSKSGSPLDLITNWTRYSIQVAQPNAETDFDTLGMDANGIYLSAL